MTTAKFVQPDYNTQSGTVYPLGIDAAVKVLARIAAAFAPHAQDTPVMTVRVDAGFIWNGLTLTEVAAQSTGTITAPVTNPRIDRVVVDAITGTVSVITGTPAGSPVAPAITAGKLPVCQALLQTTSTVITNSMLTDERVVSWLGGSFTMAGDLTFSGNARRIKGDFDNATIANRLLFQSTSSNQTSSVGVIPNGSGAGGNLAVFSTSDPDNSHITLIGASATTSDVTATKTGTGTTRNLNLNSGTGTVTVEANTGRVIIPGGQISFPATQNASADANTLDDYEEGTVTWSVGGTATYTLRVGHYTKIGRLIHVYGVVVINTIGTGSATNISGIPFTAASEAVMPVSKCSTSVTNIVSISGELIAASSFVQLRSRTAASASDAVNNIFQNGTTVEFGGSYHE